MVTLQNDVATKFNVKNWLGEMSDVARGPSVLYYYEIPLVSK